MSEISNLIKFLEKADVPETRKDLSIPANVSWMVGNLGVRNGKLDGFDLAFKELKLLYRKTFA